MEGNEDKISLEAIFKYLSPSISKALREGSLFVDPCNGAGNISYKLSSYQAAVCLTHVFMDHDEAGKTAIQKAEADGIIKSAEYHFTICNGMTNAEFEDCLDAEVYKNTLEEEFGVNLSRKEFRNSKKWSERMRDVFLSQGKPWNDSVQQKAKYLVASCVEADPENALNDHKRSSIDALISALETRLKK